MNVKTKILSAMLVCMMVITVFTGLIPTASAAAPDNTVKVGSTIYLNGTAPQQSQLVIYEDGHYLSTTHSGLQGMYSLVQTVPDHVYGPIEFEVLVSAWNMWYNTTYTVIPNVVAYPTEGAPYSVSGQTVTLTGTGYAANSDVTFTFGTYGVVAVATTNVNGTCTARFNLPDYPMGNMTITGIDESAHTGSTTFQVIPDIDVVPYYGNGANNTGVSISGAGFAANGFINTDHSSAEANLTGIEFVNSVTGYSINATSASNITVNGVGDFNAADLNLPNMPAGMYNIFITQNNSATQEFIGVYVVSPAIIATPSPAAVGDTVTVIGTGFGQNVGVTITLLNSQGLNQIVNSTVMTNEYGYFEATFVMPSVALGGQYLRATDDESNTASTISNSGPHISISPISGTVGEHTTTVNGVTSGSIDTYNKTYYDVTASGYNYQNQGTFVIDQSLGTLVTVTGQGFSANSFVDVTVSIKTVVYTVATHVPTNEQGYFQASFNFPTAPHATYQVSASESRFETAAANFTVVPGMMLYPGLVVGPSLEHIEATGYPVAGQTGVQNFLINGTDALYGTDIQAITQWAFDDNGTLIDNPLNGVSTPAEPGFILPVLEPGYYDITLVGGGISATKWIYVMNSVADMQGMINDLASMNATIVSVSHNVATIQSDVGTVQSSLDTLGGQITDINNNIATVSTKLGDVQVNLSDLGTTINATSDNVVQIQTSLGTITGKIASIDDNVATIQTDMGTLKTDVSTIKGQTSDIQDQTSSIESGNSEVSIDATPAWIAAVMAVIAAIAAIVCVVLISRKLAG